MKPYTAAEFNLFHIKKGLKNIKNGSISVREAALNARFDRLLRENKGMFEELYPKYIRIVKGL